MASTPTKDLGFVIAIFIGIGILWVLMGRPVGNADSLNSPFLSSSFVPSPRNEDKNNDGKSVIKKPSEVEANGVITIKDVSYIKSPWYGQVKLGRGNSASNTYPSEEYITLSTSRRNKDSIAITGWLLENGRKFRTYDRGSRKVVKGQSAVVAIPQGAEIFLGKSSQTLHPIILKPGDKAVVTSGKMPNRNSDIKVNFSFKTNKCTGYLEDLPKLDFTPKLKMSCPDPEKVAGASSLPDDCFTFVKRLRNCHTPDTEEYRDRNGDLVRNHLDKVTGLSRYCRDWVTTRFSYTACLGRHVTDKDFDGKEWRIFLSRQWELWDDDREVITLYDPQGRLVDQITY